MGAGVVLTVVVLGSPKVIVLAPPGATRTLVDGLVKFMSPLISVLILMDGVDGE